MDDISNQLQHKEQGKLFVRLVNRKLHFCEEKLHQQHLFLNSSYFDLFSRDNFTRTSENRVNYLFVTNKSQKESFNFSKVNVHLPYKLANHSKINNIIFVEALLA
jgi:hypothetical protein